MKVYLISHNKNVKIKQISTKEDFLIEFDLSKSGESDYFLATAISGSIWVLESRNHHMEQQQHQNYFLPTFRGDIVLIFDWNFSSV